MKNALKLFKQPQHKGCSMLASWPGIGDVSLITARYLKEKLNAEEIGEIEPVNFFEPLGVIVDNNIVEAPRFPQSKFYYWQDDKTGKGLILFIGDEQPNSKGYELTNCVLDACQKLKVQTVYSCAAAITRIYHSEEPRVWGAATSPQLIKKLSKYNLVFRGNLHIAGLNGLILGMAKERGIEGVCLLGEVPSYGTQIANPKASLAVLQVLTTILGIEIDLAELSQVAIQSSEEMERIAKRATAQFIDQFTEPIWEQDEEYYNEE